jgi:hypothetical protein
MDNPTTSSSSSLRDNHVLQKTVSQTFSSLGVSQWLIDSCKQMGIAAPTPVQVNCIPMILQVCVCSRCLGFISWILSRVVTFSDAPKRVLAKRWHSRCQYYKLFLLIRMEYMRWC